jgi:hypothetical protein
MKSRPSTDTVIINIHSAVSSRNATNVGCLINILFVLAVGADNKHRSDKFVFGELRYRRRRPEW